MEHGWTYISQDRVSEMMSAVSVWGELGAPLPSSFLLREHLPEGFDLLEPDGPALFLAFDDVAAQDADRLRAWLAQAFLPEVDGLKALATRVVDVTNDDHSFVWGARSGWNVHVVRAGVPSIVFGRREIVWNQLSIFVLGRLCVVAWHRTPGGESAGIVPSKVDAAVRNHHFGPIPTSSNSKRPLTASALGSAYMAAVIAGHGSVLERLMVRLDEWETGFVEEVATGAASGGEGTAALGQLRRATTALRSSLNDIQQRQLKGEAGYSEHWSTHSRDPIATAAVVRELRIAQGTVERLRATMMDTFLAVATEGVAAQLRRADESQVQFASLQRVFTLLTAFLLVPTLVATVFGASIALPWDDLHHRAVGMYALMGGSAIATFCTLLLVERRGRA